jgi:hypothetical protein
MNDLSLGAKYFVSSANGVHTVQPSPAPSARFHANFAPPQSATSKPRCSRYQSASAFGSRDLKNTPPMPCTRGFVVMTAPIRVEFRCAIVAQKRLDVGNLARARQRRQAGEEGLSKKPHSRFSDDVERVAIFIGKWKIISRYWEC